MDNTGSEQYRHECEVRQVAAWGKTNPKRAKRHLELVAEKRGEETARKLRFDSLMLFQKNREAA